MRPSHSPIHQVIHIQPLAATKPPMGAPCNGCGLCCLAEPCPLGVLLSRSRTGPCKALQWVEDQRQYRCGALAGTSTSDAAIGRTPLHRMHAVMGRIKERILRRWIAAGAGCDCDLEPALSGTIGAPSTHSSDMSHD